MLEQQNTDGTLDTDNTLEQALVELAEAIMPLTGNTDLDEFVEYLYQLWADFSVYWIRPIISADLEQEDEGSGSLAVAKIISLENGRKIYDYGFCLKTSPGEDYGHLSFAKLIETAQKND